jgi:hypothetical protein
VAKLDESETDAPETGPGESDTAHDAPDPEAMADSVVDEIVPLYASTIMLDTRIVAGGRLLLAR